MHDPLGWLDALGLSCKPTKYHKRTVKQVAAMRASFEKSGGARQRFLRWVARKPGATKAYGPEAVAAMKRGEVPPGKVVHHKKPLFRGGTNSKDNLVLMDAEEHARRNKELHWYRDGDNPFGLD